MERDLPDAVRHILEALHMGLPARVHHPGDHRDGGEAPSVFVLEDGVVVGAIILANRL